MTNNSNNFSVRSVFKKDKLTGTNFLDWQWKGKKRIGSKSNANPKQTPKRALMPIGGVAKGDCHYCKKLGHWNRNCQNYLEDLKKLKSVQIFDSGIYVIEVNLSTSTSWVLDTGCGSHICINVQGLRRSRTLAKGEVGLHIGNGAKVAAIAVGTYYLSLPTGLILELENCFTCLRFAETLFPFLVWTRLVFRF
jgi:hypothetical protein